MKRRLGAVLEARVAKRLHTEAIECADRPWVIAEQVDIVAVVRLVRGGCQHGQRRDRLPRLQLYKALGGGWQTSIAIITK